MSSLTVSVAGSLISSSASLSELYSLPVLVFVNVISASHWTTGTFLPSISTYSTDPSSLNDVQIRLSNLKLYQNKYQRNILELIHYKNELDNTLLLQENSINIEEYVSLEQKNRSKRDKSNKELSEIRKRIALELEEKLVVSLKKSSVSLLMFLF